MLDTLTNSILSISANHPVRVGINGIDGSGKTMLATKLAQHLQRQTDRQVILASIDDFHNAKAIRYQQGRRSARGFYEDSYNFAALLGELLTPLGPGGSRDYHTKVFDPATDQPIEQIPEHADNDAILILEGIFLFTPQLVDMFDYKIFLDVPYEVVLNRMQVRDQELLTSQAEVSALFNERYMPGQKLYIADSNPHNKSDLVIDNSDYNNPVIQ